MLKCICCGHEFDGEQEEYQTINASDPEDEAKIALFSDVLTIPENANGPVCAECLDEVRSACTDTERELFGLD